MTPPPAVVFRPASGSDARADLPADPDEAHAVRAPRILIHTAAGWRPMTPRGGEPE